MFLDCMQGISSAYPYQSNKFLGIVCQCWKNQLKQEIEVGDNVKMKQSALYCTQSESILADKVRQKMKDGTNEKTTLIKTFQHFDSENIGFVTFDQFLRVLENYGVLMPATVE